MIRNGMNVQDILSQDLVQAPAQYELNLSDKRLKEYDKSRFPMPGHEQKPVGRDKVMHDFLRKYAKNPVLFDEVVSHAKDTAFGPRQISGANEQNLSYFTGHHAANFRWNKHFRNAYNEVLKLTIPHYKLKPLKLNTDRSIKDVLPREDTHAGYSYLLGGGKKKGEYLEGIADELKKQETTAIFKGSYDRPIIIGNRYQCSGAYDENGNALSIESTKYKGRTIHMYDIYCMLTELRFSYAAQRHLGRLDLYAGGKVPSDLYQIVAYGRHNYPLWISVDYSRYDQSIPGWLIDSAFSIVKQWFSDMSTREEKLWEIVVSDFIHKGFVGPKGNMIYANDGVPSGSMFTQIIDTVCNLLIVYTYADFKGNMKNFRSIICGDDNLIFHTGWFDAQSFQSYIEKNFGIIVHPEKCDSGTKKDDPFFLSRFFTPGGIYRNPKLLTCKMIYPERFRDYQRNPSLKPELIFWSYFQAYPLGIREFYDVDLFLHDNQSLLKGLSVEDLCHVSGYLEYIIRYEKVNFSILHGVS